jgi:Uma2 family endonuclease
VPPASIAAATDGETRSTSHATITNVHVEELAMILTWPNHPLTLDEWEALPEDSAHRLELAEGMLVMCPPLPPRHQKARTRLGMHFDTQLPRGLTALPGVEVVITDEPLTIRAPDVIVIHTELFDANPARCAAADVLLAAEILSTGTRRVDTVLKFSEYEEAGIPQYWIVDPDAPTRLLAYVLVDGSYELSGEHTGDVTLDVAGHPVKIDLPVLTRR